MSIAPLPPVDALIPHRAPMQLLAQVLAADDRSLWAVADSAASAALGADPGMPGAIALEQLAQASAAFFSLAAMRAAIAGDRVPAAPGMLVACRALACDAGRQDPGASVLLQVEPLAGSPATAGLVRFQGSCWHLDHPDALAEVLAAARRQPGEPTLRCEALAEAVAARKLQPAATADFSVYVPPAATPHPPAPQKEPVPS